VDHELEVIRDQMEETRASLADKLEALESQVRETVQSASDTVTSAVDGAKDVVTSVSEGAKQVVEKVSETVDTVKESLSVSRYVEQYPWASVGVAVAAGFAVAQLVPSSRSTSGDRSEALPPASSGGYTPRQTSASHYQPSASASAPHQESSVLGSALKGVFGTAATTVEGLAVGTLMSAVKGLVMRGLPQEWQGELTRMVDQVTTQLGGKVMQGNPLDELLSHFQHHDQQQDTPQTGTSTGHSPTHQGYGM
jgi:ElaB/YqjD/DUF883 family membrane-anchored ribosome-binding protein